MRSVNFNSIFRYATMFVVFAMVMTIASDLLAQTPNLGSVSSEVKNSVSQVRTIVNYILGAVCMISLIGVIYAVATKSPHAKEFVIGFVVSIIVWIIAFKVIPA